VVWLLRRCVECGRYTLNQKNCPYCKGRVRVPHPAKFSPDDKYMQYRLALKEGSSSGENGDKREGES